MTGYNSLAIRVTPLIFLLLWSGGFTVAKIGIHDADPITLLSLRYLCVVILLLPFCLYVRPPLPASRAEWFNLLLVGFLIQVVYFGAAWTAMSLGGSAGTVALITSLQPVLVALAMPMLSSDAVSRQRWIGLGLGVLGTMLVITGNSGLHVVSVTVVLLSVLALLAFSLATVWENQYGVSRHPLTTNTAQYVVGFVCTLPIAWWFEDMHITVTVPFLFALGYLVICNSILAISLLLMMLRRGEATRVSALFFLVPPVSAFIAWIVLGEEMAAAAWLGMAVAAVGVWIVKTR